MKQNTVFYSVLYIILGFTGIQNSHAQTDARDSWMNKYWYLRNRLINDFMIVGEGQGKSIPAGSRNGSECGKTQRRNLDENFSLALTVHDGNCNLSPAVRKDYQLGFGVDASSTLGDYIAVLASEYLVIKFYTQPNDPFRTQKLNQTGYELMCALKAFDRLDANGETLMNQTNHGPDIGPQLNGFFIRNDVPLGFIVDPFDVNGDPVAPTTLDNNNPYRHYYPTALGVQNYWALNSKKTCSHANPTHYSIVAQVDTGGGLAGQQKRAEVQGVSVSGEMPPGGVPDPSKDQYNHIIMGLTMVIKGCDDNDNFNNYQFKSNARRIMNTIMTFLANNAWSCAVHPTITNYDFSNLRVDAGGEDDLGPAWYLIAKTWANTPSSHPHLDGQTNWLRDVFFVDEMIRNGVPKRTKIFNVADKVAMVMACSNAYVDVFSDIISRNPNDINDRNLTQQWLERVGHKWDYQIFPLMHAVLFNMTCNYNMSEFSDLLSAMPCDGPHYFTSDCGEGGFENREWSESNRWIHQDQRPNPDGSQGAAIKGEYNGIDYMLLYNCYLLNYFQQHQQPASGFQNELTNYQSGALPTNMSDPIFGNINYGSSSSPARIIGFKNIQSSSQVIFNTLNSANADVTYQAGEEISLLPGFSVQPGAKFSASIGFLTDCINSGASYDGIEQTNGLGKAQPALNTDNFMPYNPIDASKVSESISNEDIKLQILSVYPNPFSSELNVDIQSNNTNDIDLKVVNELGTVVKNKTLKTTGEKTLNIKLDYADLKPGCYTIVINNGSQISKRQIIKY